MKLFQFISVHSLSCVWLLATPRTAAFQASLSITNYQSLLKLISIESMMPSNHLIVCHPLLLLPSIFPSIRVFSSESVVHMRQPMYWSFSFSISPSKEYSGLISFTSFPGNSVGKEFAGNSGDPGLIPGSKDPMERDGLPTPVFLGFPVAQLIKNPPAMRKT